MIFPAGATVDPELTVAMNDQSLYGYITKSSSTPLPPGTSVRYRSDRPSIVGADPSGGIRTVRSGLATIAATMTYHGASSTTSLVVYVR